VLTIANYLNFFRSEMIRIPANCQ